MNSYVTLYVPAKYVNIKVEASQAMARMAGGVTVTEAWGVWEADPNAPLVHDRLWLLKSFVRDDDLHQLVLIVKQYASSLLDAGEQSVAIEINGVFSLIEREDVT